MNGDFTLAVHALVFLNHKRTTVSSQMLAENICTHAARVRRVMALLKRAELIETKEGRLGGGYQGALTKSVLLHPGWQMLWMAYIPVLTAFAMNDWKKQLLQI